MAKKVKRGCIACQKQDAVACAQPRAPLPGDRVTRSQPVSVTGIDHAGTCMVRIIQEGSYMCYCSHAQLRVVFRVGGFYVASRYHVSSSAVRCSSRFAFHHVFG